MKYLVDTNVCIGWLKGERSIREAWLDVTPEDVLLSSVVHAELLATMASAPFEDRADEQYGLIRAQLTAAGKPIGPNDLMIAATALAHDAILATRNAREFTRVAGLRVEVW